LNAALTLAAHGALYGGMGGAAVASIREIGNIFATKKTTATA